MHTRLNSNQQPIVRPLSESGLEPPGHAYERVRIFVVNIGIEPISMAFQTIAKPSQLLHHSGCTTGNDPAISTFTEWRVNHFPFIHHLVCKMGLEPISSDSQSEVLAFGRPTACNIKTKNRIFFRGFGLFDFVYLSSITLEQV